MTEYDKFLERVNGNAILKEGIDSIVEDTSNGSFLNLTHPNWYQHLQNDAVYQRHVAGLADFNDFTQLTFVKSQYVESADDNMKVIVVARCNFVKSRERHFESTGNAYNTNAFLVPKYCPPLDIICKAFGDSSSIPNLEITGNNKLFFKQCMGPYVCPDCSQYIHSRRKSVPEIKPWLCVQTTQVFNGRQICNTLGDTALGVCNCGPFWAVLKCEVNCRQFYGDLFRCLKVTGHVFEIIFFAESSLDENRRKKMKFFEDTIVANRPEIQPHAAARSQKDAEETRERPSGYSFKHQIPSAASVSGAAANERVVGNEPQTGTERATVCLPPSAMNLYLAEEERKKNEGDYEVVHHEFQQF